jgi:hypothetical protein
LIRFGTSATIRHQRSQMASIVRLGHSWKVTFKTTISRQLSSKADCAGKRASSVGLFFREIGYFDNYGPVRFRFRSTSGCRLHPARCSHPPNAGKVIDFGENSSGLGRHWLLVSVRGRNRPLRDLEGGSRSGSRSASCTD